MSINFTPNSHQAYLHSAIALPREHLLVMQHLINNALTLQNQNIVPKHPPPPYNNNAEPIFRPRMDMFETSSAPSIDSRPTVTAVFELPGLRKEDVHIEIVEGNMIITGARNRFKGIDLTEDNEAAKNEETKMEDDTDTAPPPGCFTVREIKRGRFRRVIALPPSVKLSDIKASMADGILTISFPGKPKPMRQSVPVI